MVVPSCPGTTTGKPRRMAEHPGGVPEPAPAGPARSSRLEGSGTPAGVQDLSCAVTRRSPPQKPSATSGYPLATLRVDRSRMSKPRWASRGRLTGRPEACPTAGTQEMVVPSRCGALKPWTPNTLCRDWSRASAKVCRRTAVNSGNAWRQRRRQLVWSPPLRKGCRGRSRRSGPAGASPRRSCS